MKKLKLFAVLGVMFIAAANLTACNTLAGAGQDIERGGEVIQDVAR